MKITKIEHWHLQVHYLENTHHYRPNCPPILVMKVHTDEGITGVGEGGRAQRYPTAFDDLIGRDPFGLSVRTMPYSIQMALYDIQGKALGVPAHKLIGTQVRGKMPVGYWSTPMEPKEFAQDTERALELGCKSHKLKARPWNIVETCRRIQDVAGPDLKILPDPNCSFGLLPDAVRLARQLEPYNIYCFEDPFRKDFFEEYALFRGKTIQPVALHLGDPKDFLQAIKLEAVDCFCMGGNVARAQAIDAICAAAGKPYFYEDGLGLGPSSCFAAHLTSTLTNATMDACSLYFIREDDIIEDGLVFKDGAIEVPDDPGLGIELDMSAVEKYAVDLASWLRTCNQPRWTGGQ